MQNYKFNLNGEWVSVSSMPDMPLLWLLREQFGLLGAKFGCGVGQCGACTVHLDSEAVLSCQITVEMLKNRSVVTIEGLGQGGMHPVQHAWLDNQVMQCGFCQPGQIMKASAFLKNNPAPNWQQVEEAMSTNLCRCGSYSRIIKAVLSVANSNDS